MKIKVFISSPYSLGDKQANVRRQIDCADELMSAGFAPFLPLLSHYQDAIHPRPYEDWMDNDWQWLSVCDCMLRLDGESPGADREQAWAGAMGTPVFHSVEEVIKFATIKI